MEIAGVVDVKNARLTYVTVGSGPPLIVVPGGPGLGHAYLRKPIAELLSDHRRLTFYDPRGSGSSTGHDAESDLTMETLVSDLDAIRGAIDAESVDLLGHSFGGLLSLYYALRHPSRVRSLVLVDGDPASWADWSYFRTVIGARRLEADAQRMSEISSADGWSREPDRVAEYFRIFLRPYFGARDLSGALDFAFDTLGFQKLNATSSAVRADLGEWDITDALRTIDQPILLVYGGQSIFRPGAAESMHAALPNARLEILPSVGHFPFLEDPAVFASLVAGFLEGSANPEMGQK